MSDSYDFIVLGGGSAGFAAARVASELGLRTAVVEGGRDVGGLCILRGCMPSKALIESANRFRTLRRAREFGLRADHLSFVGPEILERKRRLIGEFADYRRGQLEEGPFNFIRGRARFVDGHCLEILPLEEGGGGPSRRLEGKTFLIATGSHLAEISLPGLAEVGCLTSDQVLELAEPPESLIVLGAGAVGLEAAHYFAGLGCAVTVLQRGGHIVREADADIAGALELAMTKHGVRFCCGSQLLRVDRNADGRKRVHFERLGETQSAAAHEIVFALGRRPFTTGLQLGNARVELTPRGGIRAGADQRTTAGHIFAAGDVCGPYEIVHIAIQQGELAARNAARHLGRLGGGAEETDYRLKLFALFTEPQMASVGLTEREAAAAGIACDAATYAFADHGKSLVRGEAEGFVKLIARCGTREIIGAAAVGPEASELIHEIVVAMHFRATAGDLASIPHYHPTLSEIWTYPAEELAGRHQAPNPGDEEIA